MALTQADRASKIATLYNKTWQVRRGDVVSDPDTEAWHWSNYWMELRDSTFSFVKINVDGTIDTLWYISKTTHALPFIRGEDLSSSQIDIVDDRITALEST